MARPIAVALAVVIVLSALAGGVHLASADTRAATSHPGAVLFITPVDSSGNSPPFYAGLGSGTVYFEASGGADDTTGVVTITDQNYTRDGVKNPAATFNIVFHGGFNDSLGSSEYYQIPLYLNYSGLWDINLTASNT